MKVFFLWCYPAQYLKYFGARHSGVAGLGFREQRECLLDDHFAWPGEISRHMAEQGLEVEFVVPNAEAMQKTWAAEAGFGSFSVAGWEKEIALEQVRRAKPDVLWMASRFDYLGPFVQAILPHVGHVAIWVGEPWPTPPDLRGVSALVTENPATFRDAHQRFRKVIVTKPGFNPGILDDLGPVGKQYDISFVGQVLGVHRRRASLLACLIRNGIDLHLSGFTYEDDVPGSRQGLRQAAWHLVRRRSLRAAAATLQRTFRPTGFQKDVHEIRRVLQPPVFGMDMYRVLAASRMVLNVHADIAGNHAGNMRMFEATGVGACLVTEQAENMSDLFKAGDEVFTYRDESDLLALLNRLLRDSDTVDRVARAGQERTRRHHTLERMLRDLQPILAW